MTGRSEGSRGWQEVQLEFVPATTGGYDLEVFDATRGSIHGPALTE